MTIRVFSVFSIVVLSGLAAGVGACVQRANGELDEVDSEDVTEVSAPLVACNSPDCIIYDIATQDACTEVIEAATLDVSWTKGLGLEVDHTIKGGNVVAYQIQWSNGAWSGWYVAGVNDIDAKFNTANKTMRRMWSYFYDHSHKYIICKAQP